MGLLFLMNLCFINSEFYHYFLSGCCCSDSQGSTKMGQWDTLLYWFVTPELFLQSYVIIIFPFAHNPIIVIGLLLSNLTYLIHNAVLMCHKQDTFTHHV